MSGVKTVTMVTRHGVSKDNISGYTLITADYQLVSKSAKELQSLIAQNKIKVTNLDVSKKGLVSTNGALDKYTFINSQTNQVEGTPRAVILNRVEKGGKLVGYTVFTQNGTLAELNTADAVVLATKGLISNGKIRHTADGDIVSSIGGNYPLRTIEVEKAPKGQITVDLMYFGTVVDTQEEYFGAIISSTSAAEISKLAEILNKSNAKVIAGVSKVAGQSVREVLGIKRMGATSLYGVFETTVLEKLIGAKATLKNDLGKITVSAVKYTDGETDEATVTLDKNWDLKKKDTDNSKAASRVKEYTMKVVKTFEGNKIVSK